MLLESLKPLATLVLAAVFVSGCPRVRIEPAEASAAGAGGHAASVPATPSIERGRYLVSIAGCNDCHTAEFAASGGRTPEAEWLRGARIGHRGPWGTTYPTNLRLRLADFTEDQWVVFARVINARPPMPNWSLRAMTEGDLRSLYRFVRALPGEPGTAAPQPLPPGRDPTGPVLTWPEATAGESIAN